MFIWINPPAGGRTSSADGQSVLAETLFSVVTIGIGAGDPVGMLSALRSRAASGDFSPDAPMDPDVRNSCILCGAPHKKNRFFLYNIDRI